MCLGERHGLRNTFRLFEKRGLNLMKISLSDKENRGKNQIDRILVKFGLWLIVQGDELGLSQPKPLVKLL